MDFARDVIWYSDVIAVGIHGVKPGGVVMNADCCVLSKSDWMLDRIDGQPINGLNEMVPEGAGGIFIGTNDMEMVIKGERTRPTALYRLTGDRELIKLSDRINFADGFAYDAHRGRFYCNSTFESAWAFDVADDFRMTNKRRFPDKEDCDGMALDAQGNVWSTGFRSNFSIARERRWNATPAGCHASQLDHVSSLRRRSYAGLLLQLGAGRRRRYAHGRRRDHGANSLLFRGRSDTPGLKIEPARFALSQPISCR